MNKIRTVVFKAVVFLVIGLCFQSYVFAQDQVSMEDKIIGSTFKTLAKTFIAMADIDKLKKDNIDKLNRMDKEKFRKRYAKVYEVAKDLPMKIKIRYAILENMSKQQAVESIESFDKENLNMLIDSVPDTIIVKQFKKYLSEKNQELQKIGLAVQVNNLWNKILEKVNKPVQNRGAA